MSILLLLFWCLSSFSTLSYVNLAPIHGTWPIHFRGVHGRDSGAALKQFSGTDSWQNILEAEVVLDLVTTLVNEGLEPVRIGVMTPFRGQVVAIRKLLREKYFHDVNVGTIENYQAVEQDVIILSLTRANHVFVNDDVKRRMGVFGQPKQVSTTYHINVVLN